jgi:large subunit ribosomal protein L9
MSSVKVILRADISQVGKRGDICEVADGYARNYLLPRGLALKASDGAVSQAKAMRRSRDLKDAKDRSAAEEIARALVAKTVTIKARAGSEGKLFGSVTSADVVDAIAKQTGVTLERRQVALDDHIKTLGAHAVTVKLHTDVQFPVNIEVVKS